MALTQPAEIAQASNLVGGVIADARSMAATAMATGLAAIATLGNFDIAVPQLTLPAMPAPVITVSPPGAAPDDPGNLDLALGPLPAEPANLPLDPLNLPEAPLYDLVAPTLAEIDLPAPFAVQLPKAPSLSVVADPVEPGFTLPTVPTLLGLNLPDAPTLDLPLFTDTAPLKPDAPDARFVWGEVEVSSEQLATLNGALLSLVNGQSTAFAPAIEDALWQQACDDEALASHDAVELALQTVAARGFAIPGGQLVRIVQLAIGQALHKDADAARAIMVAQATLEQENFQFAFKAAMQWEAQLIEHFNAVQARALDAAKFSAAAVIDLFNAQVNLYQADVAAFGSRIEVFKARLQAELAKLEIYQAQLSAQKLLGELNTQAAAHYTAQLAGVKASAELFRTRVAAAQLAVARNKNRSLLFRSQIDGFVDQVKAGTLATQGYVVQLQNEATKTKIFGEQVAAYTARVQAYRVLTDAKLQDATMQLRQVQQFPVELYKAKIAAFQAGVGAEAARLSSVAAVFNARVDAYAVSEKVNAANAGAQADAAKTSSALYASAAQVALQSAVINIKLAQNRSETVQSALRAGGQAATQMASAAMSARNVSASLSGAVNNSAEQHASNNKTASATTGRSSSSSTHTNYSATNGTSNSSSTTNSVSTSYNDEESNSDTINTSVRNSTSRSVSNDHRLSQSYSDSATLHSRTSFSTRQVYNHKG